MPVVLSLLSVSGFCDLDVLGSPFSVLCAGRLLWPFCSFCSVVSSCLVVL